MKNKAKKIGTWTLLVTMSTGLVNEARVNVQANVKNIARNKEQISILQERSKNTEKKLNDIHGDIKTIYKVLMKASKK